ncbi:hypothetical protein ScPMuIL_011111 [Solemya velum]
MFARPVCFTCTQLRLITTEVWRTLGIGVGVWLDVNVNVGVDARSAVTKDGTVVNEVEGHKDIQNPPDDDVYISPNDEFQPLSIDEILIPSRSVLESISWKELHNFYHSYVNSHQLLCRRQVLVGRIWDGGWDLCEDAKYIPEKPCLVYSFGLKMDFTFEDKLVELHGCEVHMFDPVLKSEDTLRGTNIRLHRLGLSSYSGQHSIGPVMTLENIRQSNNHKQTRIDVVKIDIGGMEWQAIPEMLNGSSLEDVKQLAISFTIDIKNENPKEFYLLRNHPIEALQVPGAPVEKWRVDPCRNAQDGAPTFTLRMSTNRDSDPVGSQPTETFNERDDDTGTPYTSNTMITRRRRTLLLVVLLVVGIGYNVPLAKVTSSHSQPQSQSQPQAQTRARTNDTQPQTVVNDIQDVAPPGPLSDLEQRKVAIEEHSKKDLHIPSDDVLKAMSWEELHYLYHSYVNGNQALCRRHVRVGNIQDGGWVVCEDLRYRPRMPCLVYSFGINNDFSFDDGIVQRYGCEVHSFDPTMKSMGHLRGTSIRFHHLGLAASSGDHVIGPVETLTNIRKMLGHTNKTIDVIKLDIEMMEWESLPEMLSENGLKDVPQIAVEFHIDDIFQQPKKVVEESSKQRLQPFENMCEPSPFQPISLLEQKEQSPLLEVKKNQSRPSKKVKLPYDGGETVDSLLVPQNKIIRKLYWKDLHNIYHRIDQKEHIRGKKIRFHPFGLGVKTDQLTIGPVMTLQDIRAKLGHTNTRIDILKINVGKTEWMLLPQMLMNRTMKDVRQLVVEFHIRMFYQYPRERYLRFLTVLRLLYDAGYRIFQSKMNIHTIEKNKLGLKPFSKCHEVSFIKIL